MKEHPIIFKGEMVRAILEGRKTMTRRPVKWPLKVIPHSEDIHDPNGIYIQWKGFPEFGLIRPKWKIGDQLWVKETFVANNLTSIFWYRADGGPPYPKDDWDNRWQPSIFMPRYASRITLEVINIRVERVQEITEEDALKEGIVPLQMDQGDPRPRFEGLWDSIYGIGAWERNDWIWAIEFKLITGAGKGK